MAFGSKIKLRWFIPLVILVILGAAFLWLTQNINSILTKFVDEKLQAVTSSMEGAVISYDSLKIDVWKSSVSLQNINYCSNKDGLLPDSLDGYMVRIGKLDIDSIDYMDYLLSKKISVSRVKINGVSAAINSDSSKEKTEEESDTVDTSEAILKYLVGVKVNCVELTDGSLVYKDIASQMKFSFDSLYVNVMDLGYDFAGRKMLYNDSVYNLHLDNIKMVTGNGKYTLEMGGLSSQNTNGIEITNFKHICNIPKTKLAVVNGRVPAMWSSVVLDTVRTSKINIVKSILDKSVYLDTVKVRGGSVYLYKDSRFRPVKVQRPFQIALKKIPISVRVNDVDMRLHKFDYLLLAKNSPVAAAIGINNLSGHVYNVNNVNSHNVTMVLHGSVDKKGGHISMTVTLHKNARYTWDERLVVTNGRFEAYNRFIENAAGLTASGKIDKMEMICHGDTSKCTGTFLLTYSDVKAAIVKGKSPIESLNKNSKFLNFMIKLVVPKSNPRRKGDAPISYNITGKRNPYKPYFAFFFEGVKDGMQKTLLSPFNYKDRVKLSKEEKERIKAEKRRLKEEEKRLKREEREKKKEQKRKEKERKRREKEQKKQQKETEKKQKR